MTRQEFRELAASKVLVLDGATGSNLLKRGMPQGACPELWITEHPQVLMELQREYVEAGSNIVYAPTFGGNRIKLQEYGLAERMEELNHALVQISREAVAGRALVAGDLTMTGAQLEPMGELTFDELVEIYREQAAMIAEAGVDLIGIETMMSLQETRAAVLGVRGACSLPVIATMSFQKNGMTLYGVSAQSAVAVLQGLGVDAVGLNCSAGPDDMLEVVRQMKEVSGVPVIVKPNAGLPVLGSDGTASYTMTAEEFRGHMKALLAAGADIVGGCCGTTPEFIRLLGEEASQHVRAAASPEGAAADGSGRPGGARILLATERRVYSFAPGQKLTIGRDIDFSGNEELVEEYREDCFDTAVDLAFDQEDCDLIRLAAKAEGICEKEALLALAQEVSGAVNVPCMLASESLETLEYVVRHFSGIMAIELSYNQEEWKAKIISMAQAYQVPLVTLDNEIIYC